MVDRNNITYWDYQFGNMGSYHSTDYYTAKYDPSTFTLTLKNFMFSGAGYPFSPFGDEWHKNYYGIYANGDLNIVVEETNNITLAFAYAHEAMDSYAIASYGSLVIKGNGTLNAEVASPSAGGTAYICRKVFNVLWKCQCNCFK